MIICVVDRIENGIIVFLDERRGKEYYKIEAELRDGIVLEEGDYAVIEFVDGSVRVISKEDEYTKKRKSIMEDKMRRLKNKSKGSKFRK